MTVGRQPEGSHVVAIPYPAQGHINPMLQICQRLSPLGFTFTFVNTHHIHRRLQACNAGPNSNDLKESSPIDMTFVEGGVAPEDHAHNDTLRRAFLSAQEMKESVEQLISKVMRERRVAFILTDIFLGWSSETAIKFSLPWVCFFPMSAASLAAYAHFADLAEQGRRLYVPDDKESDLHLRLVDIPGLSATRLGDLPDVWNDAGNINYESMKMFHAGRKAQFVLVNTLEELEVDALQALYQGKYPTLAVGPSVPSSYMSEAIHNRTGKLSGQNESSSIRTSLFIEDRTCLSWLDKQAPASVLFISFGSISVRSDEQIAELAHAVEASGSPYLWVRKPDVSDAAHSERPAVDAENGGRGLVVPWVPQLDVLSHPAVGGFLTHCGWNSVMESLAMGVPMLCWADMGERICNQRFVVQIWKCGLDMVPDDRRYKQHVDKAALLTRAEIEKSVRSFMKEDAGASVRARAARICEAAVVAFRDTSSKFEGLAQTMREQL